MLFLLLITSYKKRWLLLAIFFFFREKKTGGDWEISFDEYIKMTIQQMYYKCNFEEIYPEYEKNILESNPEDLIGILETKLIEEDWDKKLQKWESESDLIDLNDYAKTDGDKARIIIFLILMRGIAICSILKKKEENKK